MHYIDIRTTTVWFIAPIYYSEQYRVTVCYSPTLCWQVIFQFLLNTVITVTSFVRVQNRVFVIAITNIAVWCMSLILVRMISFSFYTILISEHYREIVGYSPTPGQQICEILWNITITVGFQSHIYRATCNFFSCLKFFTSQKYRSTLPSHYFVVPGTIFWTAGRFEGLADCW